MDLGGRTQTIPLSDVGVAEQAAAESSGYERTLANAAHHRLARVLKLKGNPFVARTRFYRRRVVSSLPRLASPTATHG